MVQRRSAPRRRPTFRLGALVIGGVIALSLTVRSADATTVTSMTAASQASAADRIFVGTVTDVTSRPNANAPKYFETVVRFSLEESVAGSVPATVEVTLSGGEIGGVRQQIGGMPEFQVGEHCVVLLEPDQTPRLTSPFVGFNQGVYRVIGNDRASAVVRDWQGKPLAGVDTAAARDGAAGPTLDGFLETLRAARHP
jgi:hypothetical protein